VKFEKLNDDKKALAIFNELLRIKDFEEGKLSFYTVVGNKEILETWGLDWEENEETKPVFKVKK
jgi:hypothetical protein